MARAIQRRGVPVAAAWSGLAVLAAIGWGGAAHGAEFSATPSVSLYSEYNDNLQLTTQPHDSIWSFDLSPRLSLARRTERSSVKLDGRADLRRYLGHSSYDTDDVSLDLSSHYATELDRWSLAASAVRNTTLTGELEASGVLGGKRIPRRSYGFNPSWTRQVDAQTSVQLAYNLSDVSYPGSTSYTNYRYQEVDGSVIRQWNAKTQISFTALGSRFESPASQSKTDTLGMQAGLTYSFSENAQGSVTAGWRSSKGSGLLKERVAVPFPPYYLVIERNQTTTSTGALLSASWEQRFERGTATVSLSRNLSPGGLGVLYQTDQATLHAVRHFAPTTDLTLDIVAVQNSAAQGGTSGTNRKYISVSPGIRWRLTPWWLMAAHYQYRRQKYVSVANSASGNSVSLSIQYTWPRWSASR